MPTSEVELKEALKFHELCPFCDGGLLQVLEIPEDAEKPACFFVNCVMCSAQGPSASSALEAIESWNDRG